MRSYLEIYEDLCQKKEQRFSLRELLYIFVTETSWAGVDQQLMWLKSIKHEITGIRPGDCPGCNLETVKDMAKWVARYEHENNITYKHKPE